MSTSSDVTRTWRSIWTPPGSLGVTRVIKIAAARATIEDLGSKNGTFVGDQRVDGSRSIGDGDVITRRLREADGQGASDAELDRDRTGWKVRR